MMKLSDLQIQAALVFLGYDPGALDGIAGVNTLAALSVFAEEYGLTERSYADQTAALVGAIAGTVSKPDETLSVEPAAPKAPDLRQYLQADEKYHIPKGLNIQLSEHFTSHEFDCQCSRPACNVTIIHPQLIEAVELFRVDTGRPVTITDGGGSGYRCPAHNVDPSVGGAPGSLHTLGLAADLHCSGITPDQMIATAERRANYGELGRYSWGIHLGVFRPDGRHTRFTGG